MANQYDFPFKERLEKQYKKPLLDVLIDFRNKGLTIKEVAEMTGFSYYTVRSWCARYGVLLQIRQRFHPKANVKQKRERHFVELFKAKTINTFNVLSRRW